MRYIKIVLKKNISIVLTYIGLGIFNAFMSNYKADYFQQIIDGLSAGKLVQRIENGASAGRNVIYNFWLPVIRDLLPTIAFSIYFIWKINKAITYALLIGYVIIFIITNLLLKFLYQIREEHNDNIYL